MANICGDNRFKIISKAKEDLLESTNIEESPEEIAVLDNFLFRCWQMGWLDKYKKGYNNAIDDFKIRFFCELNNRVVRPIFSKQIQSQFTIDDIKSIFDEIVEQLR